MNSSAVKSLNNATANQWIKALLRNPKQTEQKAIHSISNHGIIKQGFDIYYRIESHKSPLVIANMLKLCLQYKHPEKALLLWNDVHSLLQQSKTVLSYPLLINVYGKCSLENTLLIFNSIHADKKNIVTLCAMMNAYIHHNFHREALQLYDSIQIQRDDICHMIAIKTCIHINDLKKGKQIAKEVLQHNKSVNLQLKTTMITLYGHCGDIAAVYKILNTIAMNTRDVVMYNAMLTALIDNDLFTDALALYDKMNVKPNDVTHTLVIKACTKSDHYEKAIDIHRQYTHQNTSIRLKTALIDMYGHKGDLDTAWEIFSSIQNANSIVCISAMMSALIHNEEHKKALELYKNIKSNIHKDETCHILALKACVNSEDYAFGKEIIGHLGKTSLKMKNTLIHFYANSLDIDHAVDVFRSISNDKVDIVSIGAMMDAYCKSDMYTQCIELFKNVNVVYRHLKPDVICFVIVFTSCIHGNEFIFGKQTHDSLKKDRKSHWLLRKSEIQASLILMYGTFGAIDVCEQIFEEIKQTQYNKYKNEIGIWNAMLTAYSRNGNIQQIKRLYDMLLQEEFNLIPDRKTYIALLNAYGHCGHVNAAKHIWKHDIKCMDVKYDAFVVSSLTDCLSRKGCLQEAKQLIGKYEDYHQDRDSNYHNESMWISLLNGCRIHGNRVLAKDVYEEYIKRFGEDESVQILMSNIYSNSTIC
eukprot:11357_1